MIDTEDTPTARRGGKDSFPPGPYRKRRVVVELSGNLTESGAAVQRAGLEIEQEQREEGRGSHPVSFTYQVIDLGPEETPDLQPEPPRPPPKPSAA
jgi:hypothetical protein